MSTIANFSICTMLPVAKGSFLVFHFIPLFVEKVTEQIVGTAKQLTSDKQSNWLFVSN